MSLRLIIAGGGTGGHVFPGIALAEAFLCLCPDGEVSFVGTEAGLEAVAVPARGFRIDFVPAGPVRGKGARGVLGLLRTAKGLLAADRVVARRPRPDFVIGVGGYASVPVALSAALRGVPLFLQEQNAVPGRANRLLGRAARRVYAGFAGAAACFPPGRVEATGNPVRREIVAAAGSRRRDLPDAPFRVFAFGGSQGARAINDLVVGMARRVKEKGGDMRFVLQTGRTAYETVERTVREEGLPVEPFPFTERMAEEFDRCHAVLMRAGALSIAEAALFGKPCVLIPYPFAADRHQDRNAEEFCAAGAGVCFRQEEATAEGVLAALELYAADPPRRAAAGEAAARFARPDAALAIVGSALARIGKAVAPGV